MINGNFDERKIESDKVKEFFKREHPLKKAVNDLDRSLLFGIAHSMNVPYDKTSEQGLRKATCDAIFKAAPKNPLACYEAKMEGVRAIYEADDRAAQEALAPNPNGAGGFPLHNPSNACFGIQCGHCVPRQDRFGSGNERNDRVQSRNDPAITMLRRPSLY